MNKKAQKVAKMLEPTMMKTVHGEEIELPKVTLGMELVIMRRFFEITKSSGLKKEEILFNIDSINKLIFTNEKTAELLMKIIATFFGKDSKWCEDNLDLTNVLKVIIPFFMSRVQALTEALPEAPQSNKKASKSG